MVAFKLFVIQKQNGLNLWTGLCATWWRLQRQKLKALLTQLTHVEDAAGEDRPPFSGRTGEQEEKDVLMRSAQYRIFATRSRKVLKGVNPFPIQERPGPKTTS
jgi:hypothetical protein